MSKYYKLLEKFEKSSNSKKVEILWVALGHMEHYNGRSKNDCIVLAMGGDINEE